MSGEPPFSVSEITTFHQSFDDDLAAYREAGAQGIGISLHRNVYGHWSPRGTIQAWEARKVAA